MAAPVAVAAPAAVAAPVAAAAPAVAALPVAAALPVRASRVATAAALKRVVSDGTIFGFEGDLSSLVVRAYLPDNTDRVVWRDGDGGVELDIQELMLAGPRQP